MVAFRVLAKTRTFVQSSPVETSLPASALFSDIDVDQHQAESGDVLTYEVIESGSYGGAWFDGSGTLHYRSIDVLGAGEHADLIRVRATDKWGATAEASIRLPIVEVRPSCVDGRSLTDAAAAVRIQPACWLDAPADYRGANLSFALTAAPEHGTITGFDPITGSFTYTPDAAHPGIDEVLVTATNNGAVRDVHHIVEVLPTP